MQWKTLQPYLEFSNGALGGKKYPSVQEKNKKEDFEIWHNPIHIWLWNPLNFSLHKFTIEKKMGGGFLCVFCVCDRRWVVIEWNFYYLISFRKSKYIENFMF